MTAGWKRLLPVGLVAAALWSQTDVKLDTPQARVVEIAAKGKQQASPLNRVLIFRDDGKIGGDEIKAGDVAWLLAGHPFEIKGKPVRIVEVEIKGTPQNPQPPLSKLDAATVDAAHYKVLFENDQVRVLRVRYEAHEKGVLHEHLLNRVVVYLNDQAKMKAGDVRMAGAATHTEENIGDQYAERIAVELK